MKRASLALAILTAGFTTLTVQADNTPQAPPFGQTWSDTSLIRADNDWSGVPGFMGYRGDKLAATIGTNPQTITADGTFTPVNVLANKKTPNTLRTGGLAEFDGIADPVVALKGSATATAPFLLLNLNTKGKQDILITCNLRDIDGSSADAVQPVAFQYRVGTNGVFTDIATAYVADASTGPSLATLVTPVTVTLPAAANDQSVVQVRWITANAPGNDEWIGIDDITVRGSDLAAETAAPSQPAGQPNNVARPLRSPKDANP